MVGIEEKIFNTHKELLCEVSSYFKAALEGQFQEAETQTIKMVDEDAATFEYFQLWLYSGTSPLTKTVTKTTGFYGVN